MTTKEQLEQKKKEVEELETKLKFEQLKEEINSHILPPGFEIKWFHRHDPFESVYALHLKYDWCLASSDKGELDQKKELQKLAEQIYTTAKTYCSSLTKEELKMFLETIKEK